MGSEGVQFVTNTWLIAAFDRLSSTRTPHTHACELSSLGYRMAVLAAPHMSFKQRDAAATHGLGVRLWQHLAKLRSLSPGQNTTDPHTNPQTPPPSPTACFDGLGESLQQLLQNTRDSWLTATTRDDKRALLGCFKGCVAAATKAMSAPHHRASSIAFEFVKSLLQKCSDMVCDSESGLLQELVDLLFAPATSCVGVLTYMGGGGNYAVL